MRRRRRFEDQRLEIVWAGVETLDPGRQHELLRELASLHALAVENPGTTADKVRAAVAALHEVAEILGHSPSIKEYRAVSQALSEFGLPPDSNVRRWMGGGWNDCLVRALLDAVPDGDFAARPIGLNDRFDDSEILAAVRTCTGELGHPPTLTEYLAWARSTDVRDRPSRVPSSYRPFERLGGFRAVLAAAGVIGESDARYAVNGRALPSRYRYRDTDITNALLAVSRALGRPPRPTEYQRERARICREASANGETQTMPTVDVIRNRYHDWNKALGGAGLEPVEHPSQPHLGRRHPTYSREQKLEWICTAWAKLGEPFTSAAYKRWRAETVKAGEVDVPGLETLTRYFGGWKKARACALPFRQRTVDVTEDGE